MRKLTRQSQNHPTSSETEPLFPALDSPAPTLRAWGPAKPSPVFDTLWDFTAKRQAIYLRRVRGEPPPWTLEPILQRFRFTNVFRAADRVSQFLIRNVIYTGDWSRKDTFFRILLFKIFNRVETWQWLEDCLGPIRWSRYSFDRYDRVLQEALDRGQSIYSAAYITPPPRLTSASRKHVNHLRLLEMMMNDGMPEKVSSAQSLREVFEELRAYPSIGPFLAYQYAIDLNYSELTDFSEADFVVPGPGARDGIHKCFSGTGGLSEVELITLLRDRQEEEFERRGLPVVTLWGRRLQLIDMQNLLCEVGKYARLAHPSIRGRSRRTRIKQTYQPGRPLPRPWFPPKWGLNPEIDERPSDARL